MDSEKLFHYNRIMFAELLDKQLIVSMNDTRGHKEWLFQDYNLNENDFEKINRGYINENKIVLYKGSNFLELEVESITRILNKLINLYGFDLKEYEIWSGVIPGKIGEIWTPIKIIKNL